MFIDGSQGSRSLPQSITGVFDVISVFDMFKVGIGPSSSHTLGPMKAGKQFADDLLEKGMMPAVTRVAVDVFGSLSLTGKGHHTDIAIILGLAGNQPDTVDIDGIPHLSATLSNVSACRWAQPSTKSISHAIPAWYFAGRICRVTRTPCKSTPSRATR